jgi:hypothetical protein
MESEIIKTVIRTGALGAVLAWALYQNQILVDKVIETNKNTVTVLAQMTFELQRIKLIPGLSEVKDGP